MELKFFAALRIARKVTLIQSLKGVGCGSVTSPVRQLGTPPSMEEFVQRFVKSIYTSCYTFLHYELGRIVNSFSL